MNKVIKLKKLLNCSKYLVEKRNTTYINTYPYNLGYCHTDNTLSFDCWNLVKALIWTSGAICHNKTFKNFAVPDNKSGLGDWTGKQILNACSNVSNDFSKLKKGEFLLTANEEHAGLFIGKHEAYGNIYNVVECNQIDNLNGVIYSYVANDGKRYRFKGGNLWGSWGYHGVMPWVDYSTKEKTVTYKTIDEIVSAIINGDFGNGETRKTKLYNYFQKLVDNKLKK